MNKLDFLSFSDLAVEVKIGGLVNTIRDLEDVLVSSKVVVVDFGFVVVVAIENGNEKLKITMLEGASISLVNIAKCFLRPLVGSSQVCWGSLHLCH